MLPRLHVHRTSCPTTPAWLLALLVPILWCAHLVPPVTRQSPVFVCDAVSSKQAGDERLSETTAMTKRGTTTHGMLMEKVTKPYLNPSPMNPSPMRPHQVPVQVFNRLQLSRGGCRSQSLEQSSYLQRRRLEMKAHEEQPAAPSAPRTAEAARGSQSQTLEQPSYLQRRRLEMRAHEEQPVVPSAPQTAEAAMGSSSKPPVLTAEAAKGSSSKSPVFSGETFLMRRSAELAAEAGPAPDQSQPRGQSSFLQRRRSELSAHGAHSMNAPGEQILAAGATPGNLPTSRSARAGESKTTTPPGEAFLMRRNAELAAQAGPSINYPDSSDRPTVWETTERDGPPRKTPSKATSSAARITIRPNPRRVGSLTMPSLEIMSRNTALAQASRYYSKIRVQALAGGGDPNMALRADMLNVIAVGAAIDEAIDFGVNASTAQKDERAWLFWEHVCEQQGTSPLRTAQDVRDYPERQAHLLAALLMYAFAVCKPTDRDRAFIKPRSALAYPLAIARIFGRWGIVMPGYKMVAAAMNGLMRAYLIYHGPYSLAPKRAEPMKFSMVRAMYDIHDKSQVGNIRWNHDDHDVFTFRMLVVFMILTAFRLAELVQHPSGEIMYITRDAVTWHLAGLVITDPTPNQLLAMRPGLDFARCRVPRSKPDQWGEIHCPFPVTLTYYKDDINGAEVLRQIEIHRPCHGDARASTPLFADANNAPYTHHRLGHILRSVLTFLYGSRAAALFTFHSFRSGLASALHAAHVDDGMIQLICRWMCPESLHVYRRMGAAEHDRHIQSAMTAKVDALQAGSVPRVSMCEGYAQLQATMMSGPGISAIQREYDEAFRAWLIGENRSSSPAPPKSKSTTPEATSTAPKRKAAADNSPKKAATKRRALFDAEKSPAELEPAGTRVPQDPPQLKPLYEAPKVGDLVFIPKECWPDEICHEHAGMGWAAKVVSRTRYTAVVSFVFARAANGAPFAHERLDWMVLKSICIDKDDDATA